jgi:DNA topoisomerase-1
VCRKCYVHPAVLEAYFGGVTVKAARRQIEEEIDLHAEKLRHEELALLELLKQRRMLEAVPQRDSK